MNVETTDERVAAARQAVLTALTERFSYIDIGRYRIDMEPDDTYYGPDNERWEEISEIAARAALGVDR